MTDDNYDESAPGTPPNNRAAEESTISAALINPDALEDLRFLQPDDFYIVRHKWIWQAILDTPQIDFLTVSEALERKGQLAEIGGPAYLTELLSQAPISLHAESYGQMVKNCSIRRSMLTSANKIAQLAYNEAEPIETVIAEAGRAADGILESVPDESQSFNDLLKEAYEETTVNSTRKDDEIGIGVPIRSLNKLLGFGIPNKYWLLAGDPGSGKSSLSLNLAHYAALRERRSVGIFSMEMSRQEITNILLSIESRIDNQRIPKGRLSDEEWTRLTHAIELLESAADRIHIFDGQMSTHEIRGQCAKIAHRFGLDFVILDYLALLRGYEKENDVSRFNRLSRDVKVLQRAINKPLLCLTHTNRDQSKRGDEPRQSDLYMGGEKDPDIVSFLWIPKDSIVGEKYQQRAIKFTKYRGGATGYCTMAEEMCCTRFYDDNTRDINFREGVNDRTQSRKDVGED